MAGSSLRCWLNMTGMDTQQCVGCCNGLLRILTSKGGALFHHDLLQVSRPKGFRDKASWVLHVARVSNGVALTLVSVWLWR